MRTTIAITLGVCLIALITFFTLTGDDLNIGKSPQSAKISVTEGNIQLSKEGNSFSLKEGEEVTVDANGLPIPTKKQPDKMAAVSTQTPSLTASSQNPSATESTNMDQETEYWVTGYSFDETGKALPNTRISLRGDDRKWVQNLTTQTNEEGYYALKFKEADEFSLLAMPQSDFLPQYANVTLSDENPEQNKNFIHPSAPLSIRGKVIDKQSGEPIANAEIAARRRDGSPYFYLKTTSNSQGEFVLKGLVESQVKITAQADGYIPYKSMTIQEENADPLSRLTVNEQTQNKEIVINLNPGHAVTVKVNDTQQNPIQGAEVSIYLSQGYSEPRDYQGETDAQGECTINTLPKMEAAALVRKDSYGEELSKAFTPGSIESPTVIEVTLDNEATVSGQVLSENNEPIKQRHLVIKNNKIKNILGRMTRTSPTYQTDTNQHGSFTFTGLNEGSYTIVVMTESMNSYAKEKDILLNKGQALKNVEIILETFDQQVKGRIIDDNNNPIPDVFVTTSTRSMEGGNFRETYSDASTDRNGEFICENLLKSDRLHIYAEKEGYQTYRYSGKMVEEITITMKAGGSVQGIVIDNQSQSPVAGALLTLKGSTTNPPQTQSANDGSFQFENVSFGFYQIIAEADDYTQTETQAFTLKTGENKENLTIKMEQGDDLTGKVITPDQQPIGGVSIGLLSKMENRNKYLMGFPGSPKLPEHALTSADGSFQLNDLSPDGDTLFLSKDGFAPTQYIITPQMYDNQPVTIQLSLGGSIEGKVVDTQQQPVQGAAIQIFNYPNNRYVYNTVTNANGEYKVDHLPPTQFLVMKPGKQMAVDADYKQVVVEEGKTVRADFGTSEGASITGTVFKGQTPSPGAHIVLQEGTEFAPSQKYQTTSNSDGRYSMNGIPKGDYLLMFTTDPQRRSINQFNADGVHVFSIQNTDQSYTIDLHTNQYQIAGTVSSAKSGTPIPDAQVQLLANYKNQIGLTNQLETVDTDQNGQFSLTPPSHGSYNVRVSRGGYSEKIQIIDIPQQTGQNGNTTTIPLNITLSLADTSVKIMVMYNGQPYQSTNLTFKTIHNGYKYSLTAQPVQDQPGTYIIDGLNDEELMIYAESRENQKELIAYPNIITPVNGQSTMMLLQLEEVRLYDTEMMPDDNAKLTVPIRLNIQGYPTASLLPYSMILPNKAMLKIPYDSPEVTLNIPGYQPVTFNPEATAKPGEWPGRASLVLPLEKQ